ncbi:MAG: hypothetical protein WD512_12915 [Candidatus Paceibacterota bacterium]
MAKNKSDLIDSIKNSIEEVEKDILRLYEKLNRVKKSDREEFLEHIIDTAHQNNSLNDSGVLYDGYLLKGVTIELISNYRKAVLNEIDELKEEMQFRTQMLERIKNQGLLSNEMKDKGIHRKNFDWIVSKFIELKKCTEATDNKAREMIIESYPKEFDNLTIGHSTIYRFIEEYKEGNKK